MFDFFPADGGGGKRGPSGITEWLAEGRGAEVTWSGVAAGLAGAKLTWESVVDVGASSSSIPGNDARKEAAGI
jgi:hypothetical protein